MKKILLLIIMAFLLCSCSDYKELNTLSYITGMGFDYVDGQYIVTYEVMDNKKDGQSVVTNTYIVTGTGESTYEAHVDAASKLNKTAYYLHSQVVVLTENIVEEKLLDVMDSIIRNPKLNEEFLLVITKDNTVEEIFSSTTDAWPSASFYIYSLIEDNEYSENYYINVPFAVFTEKINTENIDPVVSIIKTVDNEILLDGSYLFSENDLSGNLTNEESNLYNALISSDNTLPINANYEDYIVEVASKFQNASITVTDEEITLDLSVLSEIKKSDSSIDLFDDSVYENLALSISSSLEEKLINLIEILQENNSDILGFENYYYITSREDNLDKWLNAKITVNITSTISRKGIIYNVG